nr:hypothetical protein [Luteolibacter rhizosphaerae]
MAWKTEPEEGWDHYRYAQIRDFEVLRERFYHFRTGFTPHDRKIVGIDTMVSGYPR